MSRIERLELYHVSMPLKYHFTTSFGREDAIESVVLRMVRDDADGWGESSPLKAPAYSAEYAGGVFAVVRDWLAPLVLGKDYSSADELQQAMSGIKGNNFAKAAIDSAWWECDAKAHQLPLWRFLGGDSPTVAVGADFGIMESIDYLLETIQGAVDSGFTRVKLKYRPGWDLTMIESARKRFPDMVFHVDCNSAYTISDFDMLKELDHYNLAMIEQPLANDDMIDHAALQKQISTPICLDESITSIDKARKALSIGACGWVNIKYGRVGGITNAIKIHDYCQERGTPVWIGGMLESAIGGGFCTALASLSNVKYPNDIFPTDRFYAQDLAEPETILSAAAEITAQPGIGIGIEPVPERLKAMSLQSAVATSK
ncbi:MAG: o-succinylbenzoate synthase [Spirochaetales bacterium]|jgi:o-succinylbenzoate synthase|nr:o-succinylbenzoate synthase [Spirochaetales bacterium]